MTDEVMSLATLCSRASSSDTITKRLVSDPRSGAGSDVDKWAGPAGEPGVAEAVATDDKKEAARMVWVVRTRRSRALLLAA